MDIKDLDRRISYWTEQVQKSKDPAKRKYNNSTLVEHKLLKLGFELFPKEQFVEMMAWVKHAHLAHPDTQASLNYPVENFSEADRRTIEAFRAHFPLHIQRLIPNGQFPYFYIPHPRAFWGHDIIKHVGLDRFLDDYMNGTGADYFRWDVTHHSVFATLHRALFTNEYDSEIHEKVFGHLIPEPEVNNAQGLTVLKVQEDPTSELFKFEDCPELGPGNYVGQTELLRNEGIVVEFLGKRYRINMDYLHYTPDGSKVPNKTGIENLRLLICETTEPLTSTVSKRVSPDAVSVLGKNDRGSCGPLPVMGRLPYHLLSYSGPDGFYYSVMLDVKDGKPHSAWINCRS